MKALADKANKKGFNEVNRKNFTREMIKIKF